MGKQYDVVIVGGGVIGCSIAYQLAKRGKQVLLLEKNQLAGKASKAAAGMLGVQSELNEGSPLYQMAQASRNLYPALAEELKEVSGMDIEYVENGMIKLARTEEEAQSLSGVGTRTDQGERIKWLSKTQLSDCEPNLSKDVEGGLLIPRGGNVSAPNLTKALGLASARLGVEIKEDTNVSDFLKDRNRIIGVQTPNGPFYGAEIIVAGGAWSQSLLEHLGMAFNTYPVKGECFSVKLSQELVKSTIFTEECYIVPKIGGRFLVGATEHPHTFDENISISGLMHLMELATGILPGLAQAHWDKAWAGIRPQTHQGIPIIGRSKEWKGLSIATGHYRNGILLAPITGMMIADLIEGMENPHLQTLTRS
ncbi:glycine oxidase ThiO [Bacillus sp. BHET2]|uniref:glycine oxidase ThiO n=1 Tax=Bacillus sp. BHET2 TaxID=2583818 RepID=UPI00110D31CA|nr:glycine oxidase ThiO [Bacillus sp. BHET2]TMU87371.1 glycine oxidase ThiO [Bacillus sp. BHET2]